MTTVRKGQMRRILIFGNSGSGKSTLARSLAESENLSHLDLDTLAFLPTDPPQRRPLNECQQRIDEFVSQFSSWVIEGCYADLLELACSNATEIIFLNLEISQCVENAKSRPWEPHKYETKAAQDQNLEMLIGWIGSYNTRNDDCSLSAHKQLFNGFTGKKTMPTTNIR